MNTNQNEVTDARSSSTVAESCAQGDLAICGIGTLGLITSDNKEMVEYEDGNTSMAYTGIHLEEHEEYGIEPGDQWSSRDPQVIGSVSDIREALER